LDWLIDLFFYRLVGAVIQALFYWPGWLLLRILTVGRYPPKQGVEHNRFAIAVFAMVAIICLLEVIAGTP